MYTHISLTETLHDAPFPLIKFRLRSVNGNVGITTLCESLRASIAPFFDCTNFIDNAIRHEYTHSFLRSCWRHRLLVCVRLMDVSMFKIFSTRQLSSFGHYTATVLKCSVESAALKFCKLWKPVELTVRMKYREYIYHILCNLPHCDRLNI